MKIGILTYYGVHNHGAVLQANALKKVLELKGNECGFLEFERSYSNISENLAKKYKLGLGSIFFYANYLIERGPKNIIYNLKKRNTLTRFRARYLQPIVKYEDFFGDLAVIGSDEVFSLEIGVNPVLYGKGLKTRHIISYAGSFGPTSYEDIVSQGQQKMISDGFQGMDAISVRDQNSIDIVKKITGIEPTLVCDPVILYGYEREMCCFTPQIRDYILVYSYDKNMNNVVEYSYIKEYAKNKKLKILSVGYYHPWCKSINVSPIELLGWIKNATLVVTDTFHGTVMSIICNTPMVVKLRGNQNKLKFLLLEYGLLDRTITDFSLFEDVADKNVDFTAVNSVVRQRRAASMKFLEETFSEL